jgi:hypothetical protein
MTAVTQAAMTDDDGTFIVGTNIDKAFVDALYEQIDDQCHSTTNTGIKPKTITDEVIAARGSKVSVDARLDIALSASGALLFNGALNSQFADAATSGTDATTLHTYTMPADTMDANGDRIIVRGGGTLTNNGNSKTFKILINAVTAASFAFTAASTQFTYDVSIVRTAPTTAYAFGSCSIFVAGTSTFLVVSAAITGLSFVAAQVVLSQGTFATAGTITEGAFGVDLVRAA